MTAAIEPYILPCVPPPSSMDAAELLRTNVAAVDRAVQRACRKAGVAGADADDFASEVKLALLEDEGRILRGYRGDSSLATFLAVVVQNLLFDSRSRTFGRWRPTAEARRMGETAVLLERLVHRDGRSLDAVLPIVRDLDPGITREGAAAILARLPARAIRARETDFEAVDPETYASDERADERVLTAEAKRVSGETSRIMRETLQRMPLEDRMIVRLRFVSGMSIADISRMMRLPQRPLYRRIESALEQLRRALTKAGVDARTVAELIGSSSAEMDFGFAEERS
jgi:RNA polymerase sigma factor (sigma-70 family)